MLTQRFDFQNSWAYFINAISEEEMNEAGQCAEERSIFINNGEYNEQPYWVWDESQVQP